MPKKKETFESALTELEKIADTLESEELTLDDALKNFEKGIIQMRICEDKLSDAEGKLKELLEGENGELVENVLGLSRDLLNSGDE